MGRPFFTIIVVSYNAGTDMDTTLDSICKQTYGDYRILIKDGGSTDGSIQRAEKRLRIETNGISADGRHRILKGKDMGIYYAMNIAVDHLKSIDGEETEVGEAPGFIYFLNCGDTFTDERVLERMHDAIAEHMKYHGTTLPAIYYGDIFEMKTNQRVSSVPKIDDFACYRNVPSHQACFYDARLMYRYPFDTVWKVRADYEHFLRCVYVEKAETIYTGLVIADYEGGGFSETKENRKVSETERQQIIHLYLTRSQIQKFDFIRIVTLAPLRTKIAENPKTAGVYNKLKSLIYSKRK